jgi:hypothetical protein
MAVSQVTVSKIPSDIPLRLAICQDVYDRYEMTSSQKIKRAVRRCIGKCFMVPGGGILKRPINNYSLEFILFKVTFLPVFLPAVIVDGIKPSSRATDL